ncbi:hypothetical protein I6F36_24325 [Bradyrhizobium sp. BRP19]|uniref:P-loop ATPase, Sll1717 family n=1 Tax=Bradyrhizobium sp. BRP19 TaxID=2793823 RepID=UPI001CD8061C|nr:hypothetical protein [Bradyrhizobium sp. BRP19]MCA1549962.1 hypothetical protein [Bradyrhizobium sp. BRP19]
MSIGTNAAEFDDDFLLPCFVHYPPVDLCMNVASRGMVVNGRTGSGKTAILRFIGAKVSHSVTIDPTEMAMSYVTNSDVLRFLQAIGADLDLTFQVLWKHVLCIEFIRLRFNVENETASKGVFDRILDRFSRDDRKKRSINYLKNWEGKFWITMDQNIKELTEKVENQVKAEIGGEIEKFKAGGQYEKRLSADKKSEFVHRVRKIIHADQLAELAGVIDILAELEREEKKVFDETSYYIMIDRLDENWVDVSIRFKLIRALIETLKSFRRITALKILVSLRSDVLERVIQETKDISFQREKLDDYFVHLKWNKPLLRELIDSRVQKLFRKQYTQAPIYFDDVFPYNVGNTHPFDYMVERTLMRPRDIIAFVNECLKAAEGSYEVTGATIRKAEIEFSRIRRDALEQEWSSAFPTIRRLLDFIGQKQKPIVTLTELAEGKDADDLALAIFSDEKMERDPLHEAAKTHCDKAPPTAFEFLKEIAGILYRVGAVGVKLRNGTRYLYSHIDEPLLPLAQITDDTRIRIHPMLWGSFRIQIRHDAP